MSMLSGRHLTISISSGLTPSHVCACPNPGPVFPTSHVVGAFYVQWVKVRGNC